MTRADAARLILAADALGCGAAAAAVGLVPAVLRPVDRSLRARGPVTLALAATSLVMAFGLRANQPSRRQLTTAASVNAAWVGSCLVALPRQRNRVGAALVVSTALLDAAVGGVQWFLRPERQSG